MAKRISSFTTARTGTPLPASVMAPVDSPSPLIFTPGCTSVRLADYTGDRMADVTVYNKNNAAAYFGTGTGTGTFNFQSLFWSPGYDFVIPEDVNGDGKIDMVLYNSATGTEYTGISNGNGAF